MEQRQQHALKKFGILDFDAQNDNHQFIEQLNDFIKIIYIKPGSRLSADFKNLEVKDPGILFVAAGQMLRLGANFQGSIIYYGQDLYGTTLHGQELAFDELLCGELHKVPFITLSDTDSGMMSSIFNEVRHEIVQADVRREEMVRILLKQIIIKSTRLSCRLQQEQEMSLYQGSNFCRFFLQLVENNYTKYHDVASYANMLNISAKTLNKRVCKFSRFTPNEIIKRRILLEAKRLLVYTPLSVKEIGYKLGYDDPSYFIRFFSKQVEYAPQTFRLRFQQAIYAVA